MVFLTFEPHMHTRAMLRDELRQFKMLSTMLNMLLAICDVIVTAPHRVNATSLVATALTRTEQLSTTCLQRIPIVVPDSHCHASSSSGYHNRLRFSDTAGLKPVDQIFDSSHGIHSQCHAETITHPKSVLPVNAAIWENCVTSSFCLVAALGRPFWLSSISQGINLFLLNSCCKLENCRRLFLMITPSSWT